VVRASAEADGVQFDFLPGVLRNHHLPDLVAGSQLRLGGCVNRLQLNGDLAVLCSVAGDVVNVLSGLTARCTAQYGCSHESCPPIQIQKRPLLGQAHLTTNN